MPHQRITSAARSGAVAVLALATLSPAVLPAAAMPLRPAPTPAMPSVAAESVQYRHPHRAPRYVAPAPRYRPGYGPRAYNYGPGWRNCGWGGCGNNGAAVAAGVIGGLALGAAAAAAANANSGPPPNSAVSYCAQRYRSYDPASGTYLGYDGRRHACP